MDPSEAVFRWSFGVFDVFHVDWTAETMGFDQQNTEIFVGFWSDFIEFDYLTTQIWPK